MFHKKDRPHNRRRPVSSRAQSERTGRKKPGSPPRDKRNRQSDHHYSQEKIIIEKKSSVLRMLPSLLALGVIVMSGIYMLHLDVDSAKIRTADLSDTASLSQVESHIADQESYLGTFSELLGSSVLNRTKLTVRSNSIIDNFQQSHPEVAYAEIRYGIVDSTPILFVALREPHVIINVEDRDSSYVVDDTGVAFAQLASDVALEDVYQIEDDISIDVEIGQQVLPIDTIHFIDAVLHQLQVAEHTVETLALPAIANEMHVQLAGDEFVGKFDITGNPRLQSGSFMATRSQLLEENEVPNEYIDVRVSGRAYYR